MPTLDWGLIALPRQEKTRRVFALGRAFAFGLSLTWTAIVPAAFAADQDTPAPASTPAKPKAQPQQAPAKPAAPKPQAQATPAKPAAEAQKAQAQTTAAPAKPVAKTAAKKPAPKKPVVAAKAAPKKLVPPVRDAGAARPLAVSRIGPEAPMLNAHDKELFGAAMRAAAKHQWPAAAVGVAGLRNPVLRKVVDWAMLIDPGPHANFTQRTAFMAANPQWPQQADLRRLAENTIDSSVPAAAITYWFDKTPPVLTSGKVAYARALLAQGRVPDATKVARDAWITGVFDANDEREFLRDFSGVLSPADYWARTDRILYDEQTSAANRIMVRLDDDHARLARARIGLIGGAGNVDALIRDVPQALQGDPGLLYDRVRWRRQRDNGDGVFDLVPQFGEPGARPDLWWRQRFNLVREALSKGRISEAYTIAKNHGMTEPTAVAEAEWLAGWISFRFLKDAETALAHFERVYDTGRVPQDLSRGAYWTGRAAESLGRADIASNWYQRAATYITTYYGQLALSRMGTDIAIPQLPPDPQPTAEERAAFEAKDLTQALRALLEVDAKEFQWVFASALAQSSGLAVERQMVDEMLSRHARPDLGIMLARSAAREKIDLIEYGYPVPPYGYPGAPDKALILAITRQESNFDPGAMSYVGARGLMQLMPDTAKALAKTANVPYVRAKLVTDPAYNLKLGSTYLASLLNSFEGSYILTAAAYNAGPGRARQWVRQFGDPQDANVDAIDWVEQIPFNETRAYVQRVMENMMIYRAVLAGTSKIPPTLERELARRQPQVAQNH